MTDDSETEVYYVPGAANHYKPSTDVIVLDEALKDYPKAHDLILEHERQHATPEGQTLLGHLQLELETDLKKRFSNSEAMEEVQQYFSETDSQYNIGHLNTIKYSVANFARFAWNIPLSVFDVVPNTRLALRNGDYVTVVLYVASVTIFAAIAAGFVV